MNKRKLRTDVKNIGRKLDRTRIQIGDQAKKQGKKIHGNIKKKLPEVGAAARAQSRKLHAHQKKFEKQIKKKLPTNGDQIGRHIEKKITASHKIWKNMGVAFFSNKALDNLSHYSGIMLGLLMLILTDIVLIFPTDKQSLAVDAIASNFIMTLAGLLIVNIITYVAMLLLGSKTKFKVFFSTANAALFMSLIIFSIPVALVSFALFSTMLQSESAIGLFFSIIPFYNYLIYGWASESLAKLKGIKSILLALISLVLILFLNLILQQVLI